MRQDTKIVLIVSFLLALLNGGSILAEEVAQPGQVTTPSETETQWLWGEVISIDTQNKAIALKYLDYDTDTEKEISINIDDQTTYENVKSIDQIKPLDTASVDYIVTADGRNLAKNISVEKPEDLPIVEEESQQQTQEPAIGTQQ